MSWRVAAAGLTAFAVAYALTPLVRFAAIRRGWVARPAGDRWSNRVVARLGGVAIFGGFLTASLIWAPFQPPVPGLLLGCSLVFLVGLLDDFHRMAPYTKLLLQLAIGALMVMQGIRVQLIPEGWLAIPLSIFWFVLVMNAFNLLDNMDGLAAGVGAIAAAFCAAHAVSSGEGILALMALIVSGACLGFLQYNFPPARIFMGDSGSHLLGLSLAALALSGSWRHSTQLISVLAIPAFVLAVPIFDTLFVTIQRLAHQRHPFQGGIDHVSHRLAILGLSQRQTVIALYGLSTAFGLLSLTSLYLRPMSTGVTWVLALTGLLLVGAYLAKVKVYELQPMSEPPAKPVTVVETMLWHKRRLVESVIDFLLICCAYVTAYLLRFEGVLSPDLQRLVIQSLPIVIVVKLGFFVSFRLYRGVWKYVSLPDLMTIFKATMLGSLCSAVALLYLWRFEGYSRAVFVIDWLLVFVGVSAARVLERLLNEWIVGAAEGALPVLVIGAGDTGELVVRQMKQHSHWKRRVIGFLDDDPRKRGSRIHGRAVLGTRELLPSVLEMYAVREVFIAMGKPPADLIRQVQEACEQRGVRWRTITTMMPEG